MEFKDRHVKSYAIFNKLSIEFFTTDDYCNRISTYRLMS